MAFKLGLEKEGHDFNRWEAKDQKWVGVGEQVLPYLSRVGCMESESVGSQGPWSRGTTEQGSDRITGGEHGELGNVISGYGGGQVQGPGLSALTPNPTAKFFPTGNMGGVSIFACLKEKALGWWTRRELAALLLRAGYTQGMLAPASSRHRTRTQPCPWQPDPLPGAEEPKFTTKIGAEGSACLQ